MNRTGTPPRVKPCPSCGASCHIAATTCRACGHAMPRSAGTGRKRPTGEDRMIAAMLADAAARGVYKGEVPIVGKRKASKPENVNRIRSLTAEGKTLPEIAHIMRQSRSSIRRYASDYGIKLRLGESGPSFDGLVAQRNAERLSKCCELVEAGKSTAEVAEALNVCKATARNYIKRCKDRGSIVSG